MDRIRRSVRIQTVGPEENPEMRRLLEPFEREKEVGSYIVAKPDDEAAIRPWAG
jgi:hypothetical protein